MFQLLVIPSNSGANVSLFYLKKEVADAAYKNIQDSMRGAASLVKATDDFGHVLSIPPDNISYTLFVDVSRSQALGLERQLSVQAASQQLLVDYKDNPQALILLNGAMNAPSQSQRMQ